MGLGHQKRRRGRQRLPPIVWTDLVFRQPPLEDLPLVKAREAWRPAVPWGQGADSSHGGHRRKERKKLEPLAPAPIPAHGRGGRVSSPIRCSTPETRAAAPSMPQAPRAAGTREKPTTRKILVDLRPILEKIIPQREPAAPPPPPRSSSAERAGAGGLPPPAASPDIQLPTRLLLQRLQETTTSENHQLIAQALQSLRKELQGEAPASPSQGERWRLLWEPLWSRKDQARRKTRRATGLDPAARERRLVQLTWKADSPVAGDTRKAACPRIHR